MSLYGWVLILSLLGPLVFSFHPKIKFYRRWLVALLSSIVVAIPFWVWDGLATARGDWGFNQKYVGVTKIFGMPLEEILFFIVIPFCCLFIWEILEKYSKERRQKNPNNLMLVIIVLLLVVTLITKDKYYTASVSAWTMATLMAFSFFDKGLWQSRRYWRWIAITFLPFLIVNGILTSLPIVWYSNKAILGVRIGSIPVEDFLYSWSLLTLNLVIYRRFKRKRDIL